MINFLRGGFNIILFELLFNLINLKYHFLLKKLIDGLIREEKKRDNVFFLFLFVLFSYWLDFHV